MIKICGIGGEPATGKSTLLQHLLPKVGLSIPFKEGLCSGMIHLNQRMIILGSYDAGAYPGTDRLSMAAQPAVLQFLKKKHKDAEFWNVFFEGDRLFNRSFITACRVLWPSLFILLTATEATKAERRKARADSKGPQFLLSRKTKYANLSPLVDLVLPNDTTEDQRAILRVLTGQIGNGNLGPFQA